MRVADYIMQRLVENGIRHLFMITGRGMLYLSDAAAKQDGLTCVCPHHEQAAAYAAMAYAQSVNGMGACMVSTGCAGTNALTPVLCAWQDEVPMIVVSGQNTLNETVRHTGVPVRTFGQQEADIVSLAAPITKYAVMIDDPQKIAFELDKAFYLANEGRKGPVWIDVPLDIQNARVEPEKLSRFTPEKTVSGVPDLTELQVALSAAKRPVLLLGAGVAAARNDVFSFVEKHQIPVVFESAAVDVYGSALPLSIGAIGAMGANRAANFAVQNADVILSVGAKLTTMTVGNEPAKFARAAKIFAVDIDDAEFQKNTVRLHQKIVCGFADFFTLLKTDFVTPSDWSEKCAHWKEIFPKCEDFRRAGDTVDIYLLADELGKTLADDAVFVTDAGLEELITPTTIPFKAAQKCVQPASQGAMGYALPAAIGAWYAAKRQTVLVTGDGSVMMNLQELQTIAHNKIPVKIIIVNNNCYAVIRKRQKDLFRTRTVGTDSENGVSCPDFRKVADCFGLKYEKISNPAELTAKLPAVLSDSEAVICEVMAPQDQTYLHNSYARTKTGKFVQRPLEDQSPYLPRDVFLSEMIVEPIDQ